jgi:hypothetical protein
MITIPLGGIRFCRQSFGLPEIRREKRMGALICQGKVGRRREASKTREDFTAPSPLL